MVFSETFSFVRNSFDVNVTMGRLITFCVLLLFSTLTEANPFPPEYHKEYQPAYPNTYSNFAQPQLLRHDDLGSFKPDTSYARPLASNPQNTNAKYEGFVTKETLLQPLNFDYGIRNQPITQGQTVEEIQKTLQERFPTINERIDFKIQSPYTPGEAREMMLNSVPDPYVPQTYRRVENIKNIRPLGQAHYADQLLLRNSPESSAPSEYHQRAASSIKIEEQREKAAEVLAIKEAEIARATAQANARAAILNTKEAQIARPLTNSNLQQTNIYTLPKQHQYDNLPTNYHQVTQILQSNPKLKEVISSVQNKKRYLVVHPDGRVEHVDNLEPIIQKHPEHILINASSLKHHVSSIDPLTYPVGTSIPNPPPGPIPATLKAVPAVATAAASTATATAVTSAGPTLKPLPKPHISHEPAKPACGMSSTVAPVINKPVTLSPPKISTKPIVNIPTTAALASTSTVVVAPVAPVPTTPSTPAVTIPHIPTSAYTVSDYPVLSTECITENSVQVPKPTPSTKLPITTSKASNTLSSVFSTPSSPIVTPCQTTPIVDVPTIPIPPKSATVGETVADVDRSASDISVNLSSNAISQTGSSTSDVNSDSMTSTSSITTTSQTIADSANTIEPCSINVDKSPLQTESCATAGTFVDVLSEDNNDMVGFELDDCQSDCEPVLWFEATDSDFWDEILDDESNNIIYFFDVPPQPIIEKDTKTTIYCNGTVIEEITVTKRDRERDEPIVTKTVRVIEPKD